MNNLLKSNLNRLKKDKIFWIVTLAIFLFTLITMLISCQNVDRLPENYIFEDYYFNSAPYISMFLVVFISMFLGTEYSNGTLRNKIIVGKTRTSIYLSAFLTNCIVAVIILTANFSAGLVGIPTLGFFSMDLSYVIMLLVVMIFVMLSLSAIFTFVGMLCSNKTYTVLLSVILLLILIVVASNLDGRLAEPEFLSNGVVFSTESGDFTIDNTLEPNPHYLTGIKRTIVEIALELLPTGQALKVAWLDITQPIRMIIFSTVFTSVITIFGIYIFKKKDLK